MTNSNTELWVLEWFCLIFLKSNNKVLDIGDASRGVVNPSHLVPTRP